MEFPVGTVAYGLPNIVGLNTGAAFSENSAFGGPAMNSGAVGVEYCLTFGPTFNDEAAVIYHLTGAFH
jgi:hypothetical protein